MQPATFHTGEALLRAGISDPAEQAEALARWSGKQMNRRDKLLTSREAAEIAKVHKKTIQAWGRQGLLTPRRITRRRVRFSRNELLQFLGETVEG